MGRPRDPVPYIEHSFSDQLGAQLLGKVAPEGLRGSWTAVESGFAGIPQTTLRPGEGPDEYSSRLLQ
jgi:hypothetical protein